MEAEGNNRGKKVESDVSERRGSTLNTLLIPNSGEAMFFYCLTFCLLVLLIGRHHRHHRLSVFGFLSKTPKVPESILKSVGHFTRQTARS